MKLVQKALLPLAMVVPTLACAQSVSDAEAEYLSGSLCTLSQRMAKDYLAVGADIRPDKAMKDLDESVALFEQRFQLLMDYAETHHLNREFSTMADAWATYRTDVIAKPERQAAKTVITESDQLLSACYQTVHALTRQTGSVDAPLVELSEEEATLTQKIARDYFALYWHIDDSHLQQDFRESVASFDKNLHTLAGERDNTAEIQTLLGKVEAQWKFSNSGFQLDESGHYVPTVISVTTDSIYGKMEDIALKYDDLMTHQ